MQTVYRLKAGCTFFPYDGLQGVTECLIRTVDGRQFKLPAAVGDVLRALEQPATAEAIARALGARSIDISPSDVTLLMQTKYLPSGIVEAPQAVTDPAKGQRPMARLPLLLHWDLIPAHHVRALSRHLTWVFDRAAVLPALAAIIAAHGLVYAATPMLQVAPGAAVPVLLLCLGSVLCHEFGHASAVSRYGGSPGGIGFGLFVLLPSFYADVSEVWRFPRGQRMVVDLAGVYFQQIAFAAIALAAVLTEQPEYLVACRFIDVMTVLTLNPVFQFDGYWLLADWLGVPNLRRLASQHLQALIQRLLRRSTGALRSPAMPRHHYHVFVAYAMLSNLFLLGLLWASYNYLSFALVQLYQVLPALMGGALFALKTRDFASLLERCCALFFVIALPTTALVGVYRYGLAVARYGLDRVHHSQPRAPKRSSNSVPMLAGEAK